ncbi:hypothetical protein WM11_31525 [Burkholderia ubonensis]|uniref:hypothetical protein n=1 Tax=Burkholderia ubonensis TaxID=101571 RepID=UPI0007540661|nr:hypothetical protein [Burkholderia ubonensis]KVM66034.1 hypothetical protein WJ61_30685 [Burkholderia ubonensis]KVR46389.1 hypothetical protein WK18_12745 [Burkholderia ubonensis]KVU21230.1 hypothetical protein WK62_19800 [Burkholderia ubonensis]KWB74513.1 hypothetical protein WL41_15275 [Burkholderia ubonensis]KWC20045.1 hypothetical protein WL46_21975 [Burkholderia ubonensis]
MRDTDAIDALRYALAKQVPAMERGFTIQTNYGEFRIDAEDADRFAALARIILGNKLSAMEVSNV